MVDEHITKYDLGMGSNDKKALFNSGFAVDVDLIGLETQIGNTHVRNKICTKTIYPLFNGGINRITVSLDLLQLLNTSMDTRQQRNGMEIQDSFDWKHEYLFHNGKA